jgi:hypothetical protein
MNATVKIINRIIRALDELEAKGCHSIFCEYGDGLFRVRVIHIATEKVAYERTINLHEQQQEADETVEAIEKMRNSILKTSFQCYRQEFIKGKKSGKWEKTNPVIEFGDNATQAMLIDGSGYYIDDPDNGLLYFVDYNQLCETDK